jgi:hypothetical protein
MVLFDSKITQPVTSARHITALVDLMPNEYNCLLEVLV